MKYVKNKVNVFISYSWDSDEHKDWILMLGNEIEKAGANPIIDKTHLKFGCHSKLFMEKHIISSDIVLLILTPNYKKKADSRTGGVGYEYTIISQDLYDNFDSNTKYIPALRNGNRNTSVPIFLKDIIYPDLRDGKDYQKNLNDLLNQITGAALKQPDKKINTMETKYQPEIKIQKQIQGKFDHYFNTIFGIISEETSLTSGGAILKVSVKGQKELVKSKIKLWEKEIKQYHKLINDAFSDENLIVYERFLDNFKTKVFRKKLWTVDAAMRTPDPDLARYKKEFSDVLAEDILITVKHILASASEYVENTGKKLNYQKVKSIDELKLDFLDQEEMFLKQIIGYGIRSEILHKMFPANFPIMTQRSLWALYFFTDSSREFITIEKKNRTGVMRVSHNWVYDYARFTFYNNYLTQLLENKVKDYGCKINPDIRFGYNTLFLYEIAKFHGKEIKDLHVWSDLEDEFLGLK